MDHQENELIFQLSPIESSWTRYEKKLFLNAFVNVPENIADRWQKIADAIPGKTAEEVKAHYEGSERELSEIESGLVEFPSYLDDDDEDGEESYVKVKKGDSSVVSSDSDMGTNQISFGSKRVEKERKKGTPWTVEEHRRFLDGLKSFGKGDWRSISRNSVVTRTATQVASHAQKYFLRQKSEKKQKKRSSIHDITTTDTTAVVHSHPPTPKPEPAATSFHGYRPPSTPPTTPSTPTPTPTPTPAATSFYGVQPTSTPPATSFSGGGVAAPPLLPPSPPPLGFIGGQFNPGPRRDAQPPLKPQPAGVPCGSQLKGVQSPLNQWSTGFYCGQQSSVTPPATHFYGGNGREPQSPLTPVPISFYAEEGGEKGGSYSLPPLPPASFYREDIRGALSLPTILAPANFYRDQVGEPSQLVRNEFKPNYLYTLLKDHSLDGEFTQFS